MPVHIGDFGRALSRMAPSGAIEVNGERLDARSEGQVIEAGSNVIVLRGDPTGYVVRVLEPGQPVPTLPRQGEEIVKADFARNTAEVAAVERKERAAEWKRQLQGIRYGTIAAASLGGIVGLLGAGAGLGFEWAEFTEPRDTAVLLGGSLLVGIVAGIAVFFASGWIGSLLGMMEGEPGFAPDFFVVASALVGAAIGFWWKYGAVDYATLAAWSAGVGAAFTAGAYLLIWGTHQIVSPTGE